MKRVLSLLSMFMLLAVGCKSETTLAGKWESATVKGFVAEFKQDHTGTTYTPDPNHAEKSAQIPFKWSIESDGMIKIKEGKTTYTGKLVGKNLVIDVNGEKSILEKAK